MLSDSFPKVGLAAEKFLCSTVEVLVGGTIRWPWQYI